MQPGAAFAKLCLNCMLKVTRTASSHPPVQRKRMKNFALGLFIGISTAGAAAQGATDIQADTAKSMYLQDGRGIISRTPFGLCWRTGHWTPADAVPGCDGELAPPIAKAIAPDIVPPAQQTPAVLAAPEPKRCDFAATLSSDETFAFNKAVLSSAAKKRIDGEILDKLASCAKVDLILVTGHTDRLGSQQYNQKLSERRAYAVAAYLKSKGVAAEASALGAGENQPIQACEERLSRAQLIDCLAPNRRVVIEIQGTTYSRQ